MNEGGSTNGTIDAVQLGETCSAGCNPDEVCAIFVGDRCPLEYCLIDTTGDLLDLDPYCTSVCEPGECPAGYECQEVFSSSAGVDRACVAEPAVCGDAVVQRGEACDDGNTDGGDLCSADCLAVTEVATLTIDVTFKATVQGDGSPADIEQRIEQPVSQSGTECGQARITEPAANGTETWEIVLCSGEQRALLSTSLPIETYDDKLVTTVKLTNDANPGCEHNFIGSDQMGLSSTITAQATLDGSVVTGSFEGPMLSFPSAAECPNYDDAQISATFRRSL